MTIDTQPAQATTDTPTPGLLRRCWRASLWSPIGLWARAVLITLLFLFAEALGWRMCTCVLTGTSPTGNTADHAQMFAGFAYYAIYLSWVFIVPILLLGGLFMALALVYLPDKPNSDRPRPEPTKEDVK